MGTGVSKHSELSSNEMLARFVDTGHIPPTDSFWPRLLAFHLMPPISKYFFISSFSFKEFYYTKFGIILQ